MGNNPSSAANAGAAKHTCVEDRVNQKRLGAPKAEPATTTLRHNRRMVPVAAKDVPKSESSAPAEVAAQTGTDVDEPDDAGAKQSKVEMRNKRLKPDKAIYLRHWIDRMDSENLQDPQLRAITSM